MSKIERELTLKHAREKDLRENHPDYKNFEWAEVLRVAVMAVLIGGGGYMLLQELTGSSTHSSEVVIIKR